MQDMVTFVKDKLVGTRESFADVQVYIYFSYFQFPLFFPLHDNVIDIVIVYR